MIGLMVPSVDGQISNTLILNPIPPVVQSGDSIVFSGTFRTLEGYPIVDYEILIKDDVSFGIDRILGSVFTDENGDFYGEWNAIPRNDGGAYDFYAVFEGGNNIEYARSQTYSVEVYSDSTAIGTITPQYFSSKIILDSIPSTVYAGQTVTFTGSATSEGMPLPGALIYIYENDPFKPDQRIGYARTNSNGEFSIPWKVEAGLVEIDFDIYAYFDGDETHSSFQTPDQTMSVMKYWSEVVLDPFPQTVNFGEQIVFSGKVTLEKGSPEGFVVYIKDEDPFNPDDLLATAYVNKDGSFRANWSATETDADGEADIYAVLEGTELYYRSTTCDSSGITFDFGGKCISVIPLQIIGFPPEPPEIIYEEPIISYKFTGDEYIKLYYALHFDKSPVIAIVPEPDSYDKIREFIIPTQEGILLWNDSLEKKYGGDWDVDFDIITPNTIFPRKPDIIVNVVYADEICRNWGGVAYTTGFKPLNSKVCATSENPSSIMNTAGHEFAHTVGLGHAFNKSSDPMCSVENGKSTCPATVSGIVLTLLKVDNKPSDFDLAGIVSLYGTDGWKDPNNTGIIRDTKLTAKEFLEDQIDKGMDSHTKNENEENIITKLTAYHASNSIKVYGTLASCYSNFGNSVLIKIFNPSGDLITSEKLTYNSDCWFEKNILIDLQDLVAGKWKVSAEYFNEQKEMSFSISSYAIPTQPETSKIPSWIKNNAQSWSNGWISDYVFVDGIEYLINEGIIKIGNVSSNSSSSQKIPEWVKNNAGWWADGHISDDEFLEGIKFLVKNGIIKIE